MTKELKFAELPAKIAALGAPVNPFHDAVINKNLVPVTTDYVDFVPTLGKTLVTGPEGDLDNKNAVLYLATGNKLKNPEVVNDASALNDASYIKGFRAYFQLTNGAAAARSFALNLGDESTGISLILDPSSEGEGSVYSLDGRKVENATQKGVYIVNGKKVIK